MLDKIAELTALLEKGTPGPWSCDVSIIRGYEIPEIGVNGIDETDAVLIVAMRNALPELLEGYAAALARAEKAELMCKLIAEKTTEITCNNDCLYPDGWRYSENIIEWAAQAAKRESEV